MKKIISLLASVLLIFSCVFALTGCNNKEYTVKDCFTVVKIDEDSERECTIDDLLNTEQESDFEINSDATTFAIKTTKALKITKIQYVNGWGKTVVITDDPVLIKEYKANQKLDFSHLTSETQERPYRAYALQIEFKVL